MEEQILRLISEYSFLAYPVVLAWTFVEGETIVILCGALSSSLNLNVELLALSAFAGSFIGDQFYYYIGRRYGAPLLNRWPKLSKKIEWAFHLVHSHPILFILSFRFIYGIRNIAPFVIGISGVSRLKYLVLNFIAAMVWAHSFAWGGHYLGQALEDWLGDNKWFVMLGFFGLAFLVGGYGYIRQRIKARHEAAMQAAHPEADNDQSAAGSAANE